MLIFSLFFWKHFLIKNFRRKKGNTTNVKNKTIESKNKKQTSSFGFWFLRKPKTKKPKKNRPNRPDPKPKTKKTKKSDPTRKTKNQNLGFGFWFFEKPKTKKPKKSDFLGFLVFGFWFGPWGLYLFVSWLLVFCRGVATYISSSSYKRTLQKPSLVPHLPYKRTLQKPCAIKGFHSPLSLVTA